MTDMNTGKTLLVLAIVLGCFAVLWPKIFSPMMFENYNKIKPGETLCKFWRITLLRNLKVQNIVVQS